jgi:polyhydroxyalkanoate synthase
MFDHLVPPAACEMLIEKIGSTDKENVSLDTGHIGIYVSSKCQREFAPKIARWLKERDVPEDGVVVGESLQKGISKRSDSKTDVPEAKAGQVRPVKPAAKGKGKQPPVKEKQPAPAKRMIVKGRPSLTQLISETL